MVAPHLDMNIDIDFKANEEGTEFKIHIVSRGGYPLEPQDVVDAVSETMLYEFGHLPKIKRKLDS